MFLAERGSEGLATPASPPEPRELVVLAPEGAEAFVVRPTTLDADAPGEPVPLPPNVRRKLSTLVAHAPRALVGAASLHGAQRVALQVSPHSQALLGAGAAELMPSATSGALRAIVRDVRTKRIIEHGELVQAFDAAKATIALWQLAAIATAQAYLHDIDEKLATIDRNVRSIRAFLDNQSYSALESRVKSCRAHAAAIEAGEVTPAGAERIAKEMDEALHESTMLFGTYLSELKQLSSRLGQEEWGATFSLEHGKSKAESTIALGARHCRTMLHALHVRRLALAIRAVVTSQPAYTRTQAETLATDARQARTAWLSFRQTVGGKVNSLKATFAFESTNRDVQKAVRRAMAEQAQPLFEDLGAAEREARALAALPAPQPSPLTLVLDAQGELVEARRLPHST